MSGGRGLGARPSHHQAAGLRGEPTRARACRAELGLGKTVGNFRRTRYRGVERTSFAAYLGGAAYNPLRIAKLCPTG